MIDDAVNFLTKRSISNQKVGFKSSTFKGSAAYAVLRRAKEVGRLVELPLWNQWLREKREALNPEQGTRNLIT